MYLTKGTLPLRGWVTKSKQDSSAMGVMHVLEEIVNWLPIVNAIKFTFFGGKTNTRDGLNGLYNVR